MSLRVAFKDKFKIAHERINELHMKRQNGESVDSLEYSKTLSEVLGEQPPDPLILQMIQKMQSSTEDNEKEVIEFYKKDLNPDLQYITYEALRLIAEVERATSPESQHLVKQVKWLGLLEQADKEC